MLHINTSFRCVVALPNWTKRIGFGFIGFSGFMSVQGLSFFGMLRTFRISLLQNGPFRQKRPLLFIAAKKYGKPVPPVKGKTGLPPASSIEICCILAPHGAGFWQSHESIYRPPSYMVSSHLQGFSRFVFGVFKFCIFLPEYSAGLFSSAESSESSSHDGGSSEGFWLLYLEFSSLEVHPVITVPAREYLQKRSPQLCLADSPFSGTSPCPSFCVYFNMPGKSYHPPHELK